MMFFVTTLLPLILMSCATTLSGLLVDEAGKPLSVKDGKINIVNLGRPDSPSSQIVDIKEDGGFKTTAAVEAGEYLVEPLIPGYHHTSLRTKVDGSQTLTIPLSPLRKTDANLNIKPNTEVKLGRGSGSTNLTPPTY